MPSSQEMDAVVFRGPFKAVLERRPVPQIQDVGDIIVKVQYTALCGSELHVFRGHQVSEPGFIMGHEFTGIVHEAGSSVTSIKPGDSIVCPFTVSCGTCFYCKNGVSSRCAKGSLFGSPALDGGQAQYVRIPYADGTVLKTPEGIDKEAVVLMADIFPTGYFAAINAFRSLTDSQIAQSVVVLLGCGPVGLCALANAMDFSPKHLLAVDMVASRLDIAKSFGAEAWNLTPDGKGLFERVSALTDGRGADLVIEVVGNGSALRTAFDLLRPSGTISSVGVHNNEIPWTAKEAYDKNLTIHMGRCPVRTIFPEAVKEFRKKQGQLSILKDTVVSLSQAEHYYELFERNEVQKVVFKAAIT